MIKLIKRAFLRIRLTAAEIEIGDIERQLSTIPPSQRLATDEEARVATRLLVARSRRQQILNALGQ